MKILILNDTHCGIRNSSDIFIDYQTKFYDEIMFPYMEKHDIKHILHLGDYYDHRKYINFKALNANRVTFLDGLVKRGITMDIIPGNHDVFFKNTNELNSLKELQGYYINNVNIVMKPKVMDYAGCKIALLPWVNNSNYDESVDFIANCKADILGGHLELNGFELMRGVKSVQGMSGALFDRFELVMTGHFHAKSSQGPVHYLGAQFEFNWGDAHDPKYFHVFDTETRSLTPVQNPITMFHKIVYNDTSTCYNSLDISHLSGKFVKVIVEKKNDPFMFDKLIDRIQDVDIIELKIAETFDEFTGENVADSAISVEDTQSLLNTYVDNVDTDLNKERLKGFMNELYIEASNMEIS